MSKLLVVFGATGQQGSSVVNFVLNDPELSKIYKLRAITRDPNSKQSKKLSQKIEVVAGNAHDPSSLEAGLTGAHTVFAMTAPDFNKFTPDAQYDDAKAIADVSLAKGAQYIIFSTLPAIAEFSGGKCTALMPFFDGKARAEQYIRGLPIKSAFVSLGMYFENFQSQPYIAPLKDADGKWFITRNNSPKALYPWIAAVADTGKFVGAILAEPDKYEGKRFAASERLYSLEEVAEIFSKKTGTKIEYRQSSDEEYGKQLPEYSKIPLLEGFAAMEEFGYYGPGTKEQVEWSAAQARGKLTSLEEFLDQNPYKLE